MPPSKTFVRPPKKQKKQDPTYDTYDDAMDGGVEMEEQGERFRLGDKAQRQYERSLELYQRASAYSTTFDSLYNTARVLYILATSFYLSARSRITLEKSIGTFRQAIGILGSAASGSSTSGILLLSDEQALLLDAQYNLAQALLDYAEILDDENGTLARARNSRAEGLALLLEVAQGQTAWVDSRNSKLEEPTEQSGIGQIPLIEKDESSGMDVDGLADDNQTETYETHEPTSYALVETLLLIVDTYLATWDSQDQAVESPPSQGDLTTLEEVIQRIRTQQPHVPFARVEAEIAAISVAVDLAQRRFDATVSEGSVELVQSAIGEVESLLSRVKSLEAEVGSTTWDPVIKSKLNGIHLELLSWNARLSSLPSFTSIHGSSLAWTTLSSATKLVTSSLTIPVPILDVPLYKPSILLELSTLSLRRASVDHPSAIKSQAQLLINAETYVNQALEALGWSYYASTSTSGGGGSMFIPKIPHQAGWEREYLARKCLYRLAQALLRSSGTTGSNISTPTNTTSKTKLNTWTEKVIFLGKTGTGERKLRESDLKRMMEEDREDGLVVAAGGGEEVFWREYLERAGG